MASAAEMRRCDDQSNLFRVPFGGDFRAFLWCYLLLFIYERTNGTCSMGGSGLRSRFRAVIMYYCPLWHRRYSQIRVPHSFGGGKLSGMFAFAQLVGYPLLRGDLTGMAPDGVLIYDRVVSDEETPLQDDEALFRVPAHLLSSSLSISAMRSVCRFLDLPLHYRLKADGLKASISQFCCVRECRQLKVVFVRAKGHAGRFCVTPSAVVISYQNRFGSSNMCVADMQSSALPKAHIQTAEQCGPDLASSPDAEHVRQYLARLSVASDEPAFPPNIPEPRRLADFVREWTDAVNTIALAERACAVCGRLTLLAQQQVMSLKDSKLNILRNGLVVGLNSGEAGSPAVRSFLVQSAIFSQDGIDVVGVCTECACDLRADKLPKYSLANGFWVGDVPVELQELNFVEKLVVSRYRHNVCIARVTNGGFKMRANAVVFLQPVAKLCTVLPPPKEELDDVLGLIFVGPVAPTIQDFKRTPFLIRRNVVWRALQWLKLNHCNYVDVQLSEINLMSYPEDSPPVSWYHQVGDGAEPVESMSVYDRDDYKGVEDGSCPLTVHGLRGEDVANFTRDQMVAAALNHLRLGGKVIAMGHSTAAESVFKNDQMYAGMFPWLFPYGVGGFSTSYFRRPVARKDRVRAMLLYHDRRFQEDQYFPFLVFNQDQIRQSYTGGYILTERKSFDAVAEKILSIDLEALDAMIARARESGFVKPSTEAEHRCYDVMRYVEHVAGHVSGSVVARKYQRNEIRSLIIEKGVPLFFITFAPPPSKNPICLYFCGMPVHVLEDFHEMPAYQDRIRAICKNPVACARFFHYMVQLFIRVILRAGTGEDGLYGRTSAYYGTVEAQGRLALHLHLLLWIAGSPSPQDIRDRVLEHDGIFRAAVVHWLESCCQGEFSTGNYEQIKEKVRTRYANTRADYDPSADTEEGDSPRGDPTMELPSPPPEFTNDADVAAWFDQICEITDEILFRSNMHSPAHNRGCKKSPKDPCRARFPREIRQYSIVDLETGALLLKKGEEWMNTFTVVLSYILRCNTDVTCLLSGTMVRAVIAYVTDYITKQELKAYTIFEIIRMVFDQSHVLYNESKSDSDAARRILTKVVNALTARSEMGGPMISLHLLDHPDHYTDQIFKVFHWWSYLRHVSDAWGEDTSTTPDGYENIEKVSIRRHNQQLVPYHKLDDYVFRPDELESMSLVDFLRFTDVVPISAKYTRKSGEATGDDYSDDDGDGESGTGVSDHFEHVDMKSAVFRFLPHHPKARSHAVMFVKPDERYILNYVGGILPRVNHGDHDLYCRTMLTLFAPKGWRTGRELKLDDETWQSAFWRCPFSVEHRKMMANMNVLYECYDASHDLAARRRQGENFDFLSSFLGDAVADDLVQGSTDGGLFEAISMSDILAMLEKSNNKHSRAYAAVLAQENVFRDELNHDNAAAARLYPDVQWPVPDITTFVRSIDDAVNWKDLLKRAKEQVLDLRRGRGPVKTVNPEPSVVKELVPHEGFVYLTDAEKLTRAGQMDSAVVNDVRSVRVTQEMQQIIDFFSLNTGQTRAFVIALSSILRPDSPPLRMYLGGMGGTGKSRVIKAWQKFFIDRGEPYRFLVTAPTGSAAAQIDGSTYHSVLGINKSTTGGRMRNAVSIETVNRSSVLLLDEISMVACPNFYGISDIMSSTFNSLDSFAGKHVIVCGDFAQLPPPGKGNALYSSRVGVKLSAATRTRQAATMGKALWHTFTTVVLLTENMRQLSKDASERDFCTALENMRYRMCTPKDIAVIKTRVAGANPGDPSVGEPRFRDVSVIVGTNLARDLHNEIQASRFAASRRVMLRTFVSRDTMRSGRQRHSVRETQRAVQATLEPKRHSNVIARSMQASLWELPPRMTEHVPGKLRLCQDMPVLLKANEATELCATNGAEGMVVGWDSVPVDDTRDFLHTLFVKLVDPPRKLELPGLPLNVVPILPSSEPLSVNVAPGSDVRVLISRSQVRVLPNFAMTDFCSQGRTREYNVVDLRKCDTHQSMYTALSRGKSLNGTLILHNFDASRIMGGVSADLRREFRELEILAAATREFYEGTLPFNPAGQSRRYVIQRYQEVYGVHYVPPGVHPAINWSFD